MLKLLGNLDKKNLFSFTLVSALNFCVGFLIFSLLWFAFQTELHYFVIALLSTLLASVWSYQTQNRFLLKRKTLKSLISWQYLLLQTSGLLLSTIAVPAITQATNLNLLLIQLAWSFVFSILGLLVVFVYSR
jgi:hypothetical protein